MQSDDGVFISDGRSSVRLTRAGQRTEIGYPTIIEVCGGPFRGAVRDGTVQYLGFRKELEVLYETLSGQAVLSSLEGFKLALSGSGKGGIEVCVRVIGQQVPRIELSFGFAIDQTYLPPIIGQLELEFPGHYPRCSIDLPSSRLVLFEPSARVYRCENLMCVDRNERVAWKAALPENTGPDWFVHMALDGDIVRANTWTGYSLTIDQKSGRTLTCTFTK
jgi:hypothetical protein